MKCPLLDMLPVCTRCYLKSSLTYKFLILVSIARYIYLRKQLCENLRLFFKAKMGVHEQKRLGNTGVECSVCSEQEPRKLPLDVCDM
jgi:hypothetical protein